jgi:hypothetical protein
VWPFLGWQIIKYPARMWRWVQCPLRACCFASEIRVKILWNFRIRWCTYALGEFVNVDHVPCAICMMKSVNNVPRCLFNREVEISLFRPWYYLNGHMDRSVVDSLETSYDYWDQIWFDLFLSPYNIVFLGGLCITFA